MLKITISNTFLEEKKYTLSVLVKEFLGLDFEIKIDSNALSEYIFELENGKILKIKDDFFSKFTKETYLTEAALPQRIIMYSGTFTKNLPVIFGSNKIEVNNDFIVCGIDIIGSSYFMLSRWEEYVNPIRDEFDRFPAQASIAYKNGFLNRPIVNEYVELLWSIFSKLGLKQKRKLKKFNFMITHDVDVLLTYPTRTKLLKSFLADLIKRLNFKSALKKMTYLINFNNSIEKDPINKFSYLMDISEKAKTKSYFFFMGGGTTIYDHYQTYNINFLFPLLQEISTRKHNIGFHPSFDTYNNSKLWRLEHKNLEEKVNSKIVTGRQHFLRFTTPQTWQIFEDNNFDADFSLGYPEEPGFRCGVCYEYSVFNFLTKKQLKLKEYPLIFMDNTLIGYQKKEQSEIFKKAKELINQVRKYNGNFVFLWHNHLLSGYESLYENIIFQT